MNSNYKKNLDYRTLGKRIRMRRKGLGWSQEQFAEYANRSPAFIGHIERGTRIMSLATFYEITKALDCSADELLGLELKTTDAYIAAIDLLEMAQDIAKERAREKESEEWDDP